MEKTKQGQGRDKKKDEALNERFNAILSRYDDKSIKIDLLRTREIGAELERSARQ